MMILAFALFFSSGGQSPAPVLHGKFDGVAGYAAMNLDTGQRVASHGDERFPMGSVFKFPTTIALLQRVDRGEFRLDQRVTITPQEFSMGWSPIRDNAHGQSVTMTLRELLVFSLGQSDNSAVDKILSMTGGPEVVTQTLLTLGIKDIRVDRNERTLCTDSLKDMLAYSRDPRDTATPNAMIELLRIFYLRKDKLKPASHDLMMKIMENTKTGPNRIKAAVSAGSVVAHKTGQMPGTLNDAAIVTSPDGKHHIAIVVFTKASKIEDVEERDEMIRRKVREMWERAAGGTTLMPPPDQIPRSRSG